MFMLHISVNQFRIWNSNQPHGTVAATHINKASILSLEWLPNHDNVVSFIIRNEVHNIYTRECKTQCIFFM